MESLYRMGNIQTTEDIYTNKRSSIKKLYSMNKEQLEELRNQLIDQRNKNLNEPGLLHNNDLQRLFINELRQDQGKLYGKIPTHNYNLVNDFLLHVSNDIQLFVPSRQPQQQQQQQQQPQARDLLQLNETYTMKELKDSYKKNALKYHPDRNNGSDDMFDKISNAYLELLEALKLKETDRPFNELRNNSQEYIQKQESKPLQNQHMRPSGNFNQNVFNKMFNDNKIETPEDKGYNEWYKSNENTSEEPARNPKLKKFSLNLFNDTFNEEVKPPTTDIVEYTDPRELFSGGGDCQQLGNEDVSNYSGYTKNIVYSDLREAHTKSRLIDPSKVKITKYNSMDHIKAERSNIKNYTEEEWRDREIERIKREDGEKNRLDTLQQRDTRTFKNYDNIHKLMVDNVYR
jgi:curved DNA-binding protein CbpA